MAQAIGFIGGGSLFTIGAILNGLVIVANGNRMPEVNLDGSFDIEPKLAFIADRFIMGRTYSIGDFLIVIGIGVVCVVIALLGAEIISERIKEGNNNG